MGAIVARSKKTLGLEGQYDVSWEQRMNQLSDTPPPPEPAPIGPSRSERVLLYFALASVVVVAFGSAYLLFGALLGARPVAAAPPVHGLSAPTLVHGRVLDGGGGTPLQGTSVWAGETEVVTDAEGRFTLGPLPLPVAVTIKRPGYERKRLALDAAEPTLTLDRQVIRAAYLTYYGVADRGIRGRVLDLVARTELNAVVIDIKGDRGLIPYRTQVPLALEAGAQGPVIIKDFEGFIASLKGRGIYTVARIVTFKDNVLAQAKPGWAIIDTRTGKPWMDNEKLAWVDPFREEVWDYNIAIAKEAVAKGFDEVQFDYVRFPTDGRLSAARYSQPYNSQTRLPAIGAFLAKARRELGPLGAFVGADVFGYTAFNENDTDIGQRVEELTVHLDYICPM